MKPPVFSIVMPHYDGAIPHDRFVRAVSCIKAQSYPLWELLIYHDGPISNNELKSFVGKLGDKRIKFLATEQRFNDWGHSLRQMGIDAASGDYIFNTNSDNVIYQNALAILAAYSFWNKDKIKLKNSPKGRESGVHTFNSDILIFGIKMMGMFNAFGENRIRRFKGLEERFQLILPGWPPILNSIDAMQMVARKNIWMNYGGWSDKSEQSDGMQIQNITENEGYLIVPEILGEHW
jgi:glycosyltransferase involved in cell wall biosynthesis